MIPQVMIRTALPLPQARLILQFWCTNSDLATPCLDMS